MPGSQVIFWMGWNQKADLLWAFYLILLPAIIHVPAFMDLGLHCLWMLLCSNSCGFSQHTESLSQTALCVSATSCHIHCRTHCRDTWRMLEADEIPVITRKPAQDCLTPSILGACLQFITLISTRLKFSPLSVCFCLSVSTF